MRLKTRITAAALAAGMLMAVVLTGCGAGGSTSFEAEASQKQIDYRDIVVRVPQAETLAGKRKADTMRVTASLAYGEEVAATEIWEGAPQEEVELEVPYFGRWDVEIAFLKEEKQVAAQTTTVGVAAESYNIAPLIASTPVLIFSLKYFYEIPTQTENGDPIPTIVTLARDQQYDWANLPENMYANPYLNEEDKGATDFDVLNVQMPKIQAYVEELIELNSDSTFTFYVNDHHAGKVLPELVFHTGLAEDRYAIRYITDGSGTYTRLFQAVYGGVEDASAVHEQMVSEYMELRERLQAGEELTDYEKEMFGTYTYAALDVEPDAQWWVIRKSAGDTFRIEDEAFAERLVEDERVTNNYINSLLAQVEEAGREEELRALYKFEDEVYDQAEAEGKEPMMILGSSASMEEEHPLDDYIRLTQAYYGDAYAYIYKGHPGNIPDEARIAELEAMGMQCVDASIAAELFLFYHPETRLSGYPSTTFQNAPSAENCCGIYLVNKDRAYHSEEDMWANVKEYAANAEFFASKIGEEDDPLFPVREEILALLPDPGHTYYLLEFNEGEPYAVGLYDVEEQELTLYTETADGVYEEVER